MATFNFAETNGTTLETIDTKWDGDSGNLVTNGGVIQPDTGSSGFGDYNVYYNNAHGALQSSQAVLKAGSFAAGQLKRLWIQRNGSQVGYEARWDGNSKVSLYRLGVYQAGGGGSDSPVDHSTTDATVLLEIVTGGVVNVRVNGSVILTFTDGSPLTGGFPGFGLYGAGTPASAQFDDWTDGVAGGPPPSGDLVVPSAPAQRNRRHSGRFL